MNDIEHLFHNDLKRSTFIEAVADDQFDFVDHMANEVDDTNSRK